MNKNDVVVMNSGHGYSQGRGIIVSDKLKIWNDTQEIMCDGFLVSGEDGQMYVYFDYLLILVKNVFE